MEILLCVCSSIGFAIFDGRVGSMQVAAQMGRPTGAAEAEPPSSRISRAEGHERQENREEKRRLQEEAYKEQARKDFFERKALEQKARAQVCILSPHFVQLLCDWRCVIV